MAELDSTITTELHSLHDVLSSNRRERSELLTDPPVVEYLAHLTTLQLSSLESEPTTLSSSAAQLTNALTTLCHTSYPTFLSLHSTTSTLSSSLASLSSSLDSLISTLPSLESSTKKFAQETRTIQQDRRKASLVLEHHDKLADILSLPLLLDSCVRNHSYNDALLLSNHASALAKRFPNNPLVQSVRDECESRMQAMLGQLLGVLHEQAKLPALFRAITFLRKMEVLDEDELALAFLAGRSLYLSTALKASEIEKKGIDEGSDKAKESYARYLKRYIDVWREGVYDVITQFTTIFIERAPSSSSEPPTRLSALLATFATHHLDLLLSTLRDNLPQISDPSLLTSLLTQLTYCANSFARVDMDFKALISPVFIDAVRQAFSRELDVALEGWKGQFGLHDDGRKHKEIVKKPSQFLIAQVSLHSPPLPTSSQKESQLSAAPNSPPQLLVSYPPLASFTNQLLTALNGLRLLAPVELERDILLLTDNILASAGNVLLDYMREKSWVPNRQLVEEDEREDSIVKAACSVYFELFLPFIRRALLEGVYGVPFGETGPKDVGEGLSRVLELWGSS